MEYFVFCSQTVVVARKLKKLLPEECGVTVSIAKGDTINGRLLDTFDNELLNSSIVLLQQENSLLLADLGRGRLLRQRISGEWKFAHQLQPGEVSEKLQKISRLRAFLTVGEVTYTIDKGLLLDDEHKTRARFQLINLISAKNSLSLGFTQYLRGYNKAHTDLVDSLKRFGACDPQSFGNIYRALDIDRPEYSSKPLLSLSANARAKQTAVSIIGCFIKVAVANENGVVADYDTEFLHDYRVSFRKVRSVLSLFKGVFGAEQTAELKAEFASLMQYTNSLRDLDVYLLERDNYFSLVPETAHQGLKALFVYLQLERQKELKKVVKNLRSKAYKKKRKKMEKLFASSKNLSSGPNSGKASKKFAAELVRKRYRKVCSIAAKIDANTADEIVHELRISCKKLRYLMEFFMPLDPGTGIKRLIKSLKILQDNLGKFNDYSVQQGFLRQIVSTELPAFKEHEILVTEAIGALTAMLYRLQLKERKQVMKNFASFNSEETRGLIKKLFEQEGSRR
jgi:CHAD domain-containing protein